MIIGVSGYIGSGKDTVGSIIQYLDYVSFMRGKLEERERIKYTYPVQILSFDEWMKPNIHKSGYDISGAAMYQINNFGRTWKIKKWAAKLKEISSILTGVPVEMFEDQEFKKKYMGDQWGMTYREFLQKLGTDAMRNHLHSNIWVNALMSEYDDSCNWVITDTRFPNEANAIKEKGGIIIRVERDSAVTGAYSINRFGRKIKEGHASETSLDNWDFDEVVSNDGIIGDLIVKIKNIIDRYHFN